MIESEVRARAANARRICTAHGIAQAEIAAYVGASQSQVSRILKGEGIRASRLFEEVCLFVERFEGGISADVVKNGRRLFEKDAVRSNSELIEALQATWDGSASHAKALAAVIRSLAILKPS